jgi:hypothetical protein
MVSFLAYATCCTVAVFLNSSKSTEKRIVCWICAITLILGVVLDPYAQKLPGIMAYLLMGCLNTLALICMPVVASYVIVPILFMIGLFLCVFGALGLYYDFYDWVPYYFVTHALNIIQILVLIGGSDVFSRVLRRRLGIDGYNH